MSCLQIDYDEKYPTEAEVAALHQFLLRKNYRISEIDTNRFITVIRHFLHEEARGLVVDHGYLNQTLRQDFMSDPFLARDLAMIALHTARYHCLMRWI